jgi:hypothetical protein
MRLAHVLLVLGLLPAAPAGAQLVPVPPRAELRTFEWTEAFPVTPPFAQWTQVAVVSATGTTTWFHADSLRWGRDGRLQLDALFYGTEGYLRTWLTLSCDASRVIQTQARAAVVVDPNGNIRPTSSVTEGGISYELRIADSVYDRVCSDAAFRDQYMAG